MGDDVGGNFFVMGRREDSVCKFCGAGGEWNFVNVEINKIRGIGIFGVFICYLLWKI